MVVSEHQVQRLYRRPELSRHRAVAAVRDRAGHVEYGERRRHEARFLQGARRRLARAISLRREDLMHQGSRRGGEGELVVRQRRRRSTPHNPTSRHHAPRASLANKPTRTACSSKRHPRVFSRSMASTASRSPTSWHRRASRMAASTGISNRRTNSPRSRARRRLKKRRRAGGRLGKKAPTSRRSSMPWRSTTQREAAGSTRPRMSRQFARGRRGPRGHVEARSERLCARTEDAHRYPDVVLEGASNEEVTQARARAHVDADRRGGRWRVRCATIRFPTRSSKPRANICASIVSDACEAERGLSITARHRQQQVRQQFFVCRQCRRALDSAVAAAGLVHIMAR